MPGECYSGASKLLEDYTGSSAAMPFGFCIVLEQFISYGAGRL